MALDPQVARRLWDERYRNYLQAVARKNSYLNEFNDPEDLFQDLSIHVWMKAVKAFDAESVTYTTDVNRAFNSFLETIKGQYLSSLSSHSKTGPQDMIRKQVSLDKPVDTGGGEEGERFIDMLPTESQDPSDRGELEAAMEGLPPELREPLTFIIDNASKGDFSKVMDEVRERWPGLTQRRLYNAILEQPKFLRFLSELPMTEYTR